MPKARFTDKAKLTLLRTFADQAVIAIENAAVQRDQGSAGAADRHGRYPEGDRQFAIDVQPVFEAIAASANGLLGGFSTAVFRFVDDIAYLAAFTPTTPAADSVLQSSFPMPLADFEQFELAKTGQPVEVADTEQLLNRRIKEIARMRGFQICCRAADERRGADRPDQRHANGNRLVCRPSCPVAANLCRPGRDRDRERAVVR